MLAFGDVLGFLAGGHGVEVGQGQAAGAPVFGDRPGQGVTVIHDRVGQPVRESSFDTAWQRLMVKVAQAGGLRFTFHDLKARGVSDFEGDKQKASGHKTPQMVQRYNRKLIVVESTR